MIDATDQIVGRLGAKVAKKALLGEKIDIVNAEKAVISGKKPEVLAKYKARLARGDWSTGPHFKRSPDRLLKRMIRNMLPFKQPKGRTALANIKCWVGVPEAFKDQKAESFKEAEASKLTVNSISVGELSKLLGGNFG